jgi:hypothetical protein
MIIIFMLKILKLLTYVAYFSKMVIRKIKKYSNL